MTISAVLATILVLAGVRWMRAWVAEGRLMPEAAYRRPVIAFEAARRWRFMVVALAPVLPAIFAPRLVGWEALGPFESVRWVAAAAAAVLAWSHATYARNAFLGQAHVLDRALLIGLAALVALHPVASAPLVVQMCVMARQFEHPRCFEYSLTPVRLPLDMLMAVAMWPAAVLLCGATPALLVVLLLAVAGVQYFAAGLAKALIGPSPWWWALHDRPHYLMAAAMGQGWLGNPPRKSVFACTRLMRRLDRPGAIGAFVLECASLALVVDRRLAIALLLAKIAMHAGIVLVSGLNFWKWVVVDAALVWMLAVMPESAAREVFTPAHAALGAAIVATQWLHLRGVRFGWLNTRWTSTFVVEAVGESGAAYVVPNTALAPYDLAFGQHRHYFLCRQPVVVSTYSSIGASADAELKWREIDAAAGEEEALDRLRERFGRREHDEKKAIEFDRFFKRIFDEFNRDEVRRPWWKWFAAPCHILAGAGKDGYRRQERIVTVRIWHREGWYDGHGIRTISNELVREVIVGQRDARPDALAFEAQPVGVAA